MLLIKRKGPFMVMVTTEAVHSLFFFYLRLWKFSTEFRVGRW